MWQEKEVISMCFAKQYIDSVLYAISAFINNIYLVNPAEQNAYFQLMVWIGSM